MEKMKKADLTDVTFIVPVRINSAEKLENLNMAIDSLLSEFETQIIVLEADTEELALLRPEVEKIFVFDGGPVFHRTKYLNQLARMVKTRFIALWGENVLVKNRQICGAVNLLRENAADMVFPYDGSVYDTPPMLKELYKKEKRMDVFTANIEKCPTSFGHFSVDGGVFVNREPYIKAGMENEELYGWNLEDSERVKRWEILGYRTGRVKGPLFRLHQPRKVNSWQSGNNLKVESLKEYLKVCKMNKPELIAANIKVNNNGQAFSQDECTFNPLPAIQSLWVGKGLSEMEKLSISSFLQNGHDFHLYVYGDIKGIPEGTTLMDAGKIISPDKIFKYRDFDSYAGFSNIFRYKLLLEKGGYWVDLDTVCLRPFLYSTEYIFGSQKPWYPKYKDEVVAASCLIKVPVGSAIMRYCYNESVSKKTDELKWGQIGPQLLTNAIEKFNLWQYVANPEVSCPVDVWDWDKIFNGALDSNILIGSHAVHLWNEMWRRNKIDKSGSFSENSIYGQLKKRYLFHLREQI